MQELIITTPEQLKSLIEATVKAELCRQLQTFGQAKVPTDTNSELLTRDDAAKYLHITLPTLNTYTKSGRIKGYRLGGRVFYKRSELTEGLKAIRTSSDYSLFKNRRA